MRLACMCQGHLCYCQYQSPGFVRLRVWHNMPCCMYSMVVSYDTHWYFFHTFTVCDVLSMNDWNRL